MRVDVKKVIKVMKVMNAKREVHAGIALQGSLCGV